MLVHAKDEGVRGDVRYFFVQRRIRDKFTPFQGVTNRQDGNFIDLYRLFGMHFEISQSEPPEGVHVFVTPLLCNIFHRKIAVADHAGNTARHDMFAVSDREFLLFFRYEIEGKLPRKLPMQIEKIHAALLSDQGRLRRSGNDKFFDRTGQKCDVLHDNRAIAPLFRIRRRIV